MWPDDVDGDVFRRMEENGFDFELEYIIDLNLDFDHWPLSSVELSEIREMFPEVEVINPEEGADADSSRSVGYLQLQVKRKLEYSYIMKAQAVLSEKLENTVVDVTLGERASGSA